MIFGGEGGLKGNKWYWKKYNKDYKKEKKPLFKDDMIVKIQKNQQKSKRINPKESKRKQQEEKN